jgi:hypothetical protein
VIRLVVLACVLISSTASAEPGFGIAVNNPIMWRDQESIGGSLYYRFLPRQFIRLNVSGYRHAGTPVQHALGFARDGYIDDYDGRATGRAFDFSVGWMYFPLRSFDGPTLEAAWLLREDHRHEDVMDGRFHRDTRIEAARALIGWSWLFRDHWFASVAAGGSVGKANGHEWGDGMDSREVSAWTSSFEGYVRLGLVFGN